jgi:hypothetical protein
MISVFRLMQASRPRLRHVCQIVHVDSHAVLHEVSLALIRLVYPVPKGIRLVGLTLSNFAGGGAKLGDEISLLEESRLTA